MNDATMFLVVTVICLGYTVGIVIDDDIKTRSLSLPDYDISSIPDYQVVYYEEKDQKLGFEIGHQQYDWACPEMGEYGTTEECIRYWDSLVTLEKNEGRYKALQKLNNDGHLSDLTRAIIFEIDGILLPDLDEIQMEKEN